MKPLKIANQRIALWAALMIWGLLLFTNNLSAQSLNFTLRESIPIPDGTTDVLSVRDMDGDGALDIVVENDNIPRTISVLERSGSTFVTRFTITKHYIIRGYAVADVDGDGFPEILSSDSQGHIEIWEASEDNVYTSIYMDTPGNYIERPVISGDSDGDGNREFLIAQESFPSHLIILEASSDNVYEQTILSGLSGRGGNNVVAGALDLDGDGAPETVFSDDNYEPAWITYVYENEVVVFQANLLSFGLGDTDGNGRGEIIGLDYLGYPNPTLKILESTGSNDDFIEVFSGPREGYFPLDVDNDGRTELVRRSDNGSGVTNTFIISTRTGSTITEIYNSDTLLHDFSGDITRILSIGDTNDDGQLELAVKQGNQIHILELCSATISVSIDIKPGSDPNCFNNNGHGVIPVAILGSADFNVTTIDPDTVELEGLAVKAVGKSNKLLAHYEDVNTDGYDDLVLQIEDQDRVFEEGDTTATLTGKLYEEYGGSPIEGTDTICIVP